MRAALYCRVSTDEQLDNASLPTQEASCRAWCAERGHEVVAVYADTASGTLWERPELQRLLADAQRGLFDLVVCYSTDRFSRDPEHLAALRVMLGMAGVELDCVTEPIPRDATGSLVAFVRSWAASREWEQIRERTLRGKRARVERGLYPGAGPDLYGYEKDRESGTLRILEPEASVVRQVYEWAAEGVGTLEIVRRLNDAGIPPPSARKFRRTRPGSPKWRPSQLRRILRDPRYCGEPVAWRYQYDREKRYTVERPRAEWIRLPDGTVPAIVDRVLWERVQRRLDVSRGEWQRNRSEWRRYLLRGLIYCAVCGGRMYAECYRNRYGTRFLYYRCASRRRDGPCGAGVVPALWIEGEVWAAVRSFLVRPEVIEAVVESQLAGSDGELERAIEAAKARIARIDAGIDRLLRQARLSESIPWEAVERQVAEATRERRAEERLLAELEARLQAARLTRERARQLAEWARSVAANLDDMDFDERRKILEILGVRVIANGRQWRGEPPWLFGVTAQ